MSRKSVLMFLTASLLSACSPQGPQVSQDGDKVVIKTTDGGNTTTTVNIAGGSSPYPVDFPITQYPGSKVALSQSTALSSGTGVGGTSSLMLETSDMPDKIMPFYKDWFTRNGWTIKAEVNVTGMSNITAEKDARSISVYTTGDGSKSMITISIQNK